MDPVQKPTYRIIYTLFFMLTLRLRQLRLRLYFCRVRNQRRLVRGRAIRAKIYVLVFNTTEQVCVSRGDVALYVGEDSASNGVRDELLPGGRTGICCAGKSTVDQL